MTERSKLAAFLTSGCAKNASRESMWATFVLCFVLIGNAAVGVRMGPAAARWGIPFVVAAAVWFMREHIRNLRNYDELQMRIYLEALAMGCMGVFLLGMLWPSLQRAELVGRFEADYVTLGLLAGFVIGYINSQRRYR